MAEPVIPFWVDEALSVGYWDGLWLAGQLLPGKWKLGVKKARDVEKAKQGGIDGNALKDKGYLGAVLSATGLIWTKDQWVELETLIPQFDPKAAGSIRTPVDIWHPAAQLLSVYTVYVREIEVPQLTSQILTVNFSLEEWFASLKPAKAPGKKTDGVDPGNKPTGFDGAGGFNAGGGRGFVNPDVVTPPVA
jgi:hypothetical protein